MRPIAHLPFILGVLRRLEVATVIESLIAPHPRHALSTGCGVDAMVLAIRDGDHALDKVGQRLAERGMLALLHIQYTACWAADEASALRTAYEYWPNGGLKSELSQELPTPAYFAQAVQLVRAEELGQMIVCGPDPAKHLEKIHRLAEAGYDHIYVHQVGPDQEGFFRFYAKEILPHVP